MTEEQKLNDFNVLCKILDENYPFWIDIGQAGISKEKIYILVDDKVCSYAENFVMFCKNTKFATLIGTATKGDEGIADPLLFVLPNSGLLIRFSVFYVLNQDGSGNEANRTQPDIIISKNEDALKKCIELIDQ